MRRSVGWVGFGLVAIIAQLALAAGGAEQAAIDDIFKAMKVTRVVPPVPAPDVVLPALDGGSIRLADLRGAIVFVGFFHTT